MLRITKIADYGFLLLTYIARQKEDALHNAKDLSSSLDIPLPTVSKILKILTQKGILKSQQGSKGGYTLAKPAKKISAANIIEAIEGPIAITDCTSKEGCPRNCSTSPNWKMLNQSIVSTLGNLSLLDLAQ